MEDKIKLQERATALVEKLSKLDYGPSVKQRPGKHEFYTHMDVESFIRFMAEVTGEESHLQSKKYLPYIQLLQKKSIKDLGKVIYGEDFAENRVTWEHNSNYAGKKLAMPS